MAKIIGFFSSPYPFYEDALQALKLSTGIGFFIGLFCYLFRPFGLNDVDGISLLGFGVVSFLVCAFYMIVLPLFFKKTLSHNSWKVYKEILWILLITTSIATANYFYLGFIFDAGYSFNARIFFFVLTCTALVAIIPAITIILYKQVFVFRKIIKEVEKLDAKLLSRKVMLHEEDENKKLHFKSDTKKNDVKIYIDQFITLSSFGNYIEILFYEEGQVMKRLIRNTISNVEKDIADIQNIIRCHRSHIINVDKVIKVKGNLQGYQLFFEATEIRIPVSRSYTKKIQQAIMK